MFCSGLATKWRSARTVCVYHSTWYYGEDSIVYALPRQRNFRAKAFVNCCNGLSILHSSPVFSLLSYTVTAARVHCILLWRGSVPAEKFKFTRQCMGVEVLEKLTELLYRYNVLRASSRRSFRYKVRRQRPGTGKTQFKTFWTCTRSSFQMKRTYIYTHLPTNFHMNTTLAGLSNICDDFGYSNFNELCTLIEGVCFHSLATVI